MNVGPLSGIVGSAAGSSLAQSSADVEHVRQQTNVQQRRIASIEQAARAAGIAEPDGQDLETHDRDADGRRPWELPPQPSRPQPLSPDKQCQNDSGCLGLSLDVTG